MQEQQARQDIDALLKTYFDGLYHGDPARLREVFHPQAQLFGEVRGAPYQNTVDGWLNAVASRPSPQAKGESFQMETLEVQLHNQIAYVRAHCPMLGFNYFDYLALMHNGERWLITNKLFTHVDA
ncbi:hypothetical protein GCM10011487_52490 [Steroidobacter agaridevorans]|uniref:Nuclear transport factor 2 family protein n=1 Tax=Steroidobacter agaridevorans TaxID=2695856 RepID=A0A829YJ88_9GAMM|nr:nuclear transport factor 2 family protein [Steroidobacter agaridevorans]GFE83249.1 hypothetical protein GCM10011487_52490 [Steroidobacter agaridevorans]